MSVKSPLLGHVTPDMKKCLTLLLIFSWPLKFLSILHQTHSNSPFYWNTNSVNTVLPPSSRLCQLWSQKGDLQRAWNRDRRAVWDQVGLSHCRHEGLVMVRDEARLKRGHRNYQSRRGHQCSETTLPGESRFHISPPRGFEPGFLVIGSKRVVHWTSETWWDEVRLHALHTWLISLGDVTVQQNRLLSCAPESGCIVYHNFVLIFVPHFS